MILKLPLIPRIYNYFRWWANIFVSGSYLNEHSTKIYNIKYMKSVIAALTDRAVTALFCDYSVKN